MKPTLAKSEHAHPALPAPPAPPAVLPDRLRQRLESMDVVLAVLDARGNARMVGAGSSDRPNSPGWTLTQIVVGSPLLAQAVQSKWSVLYDGCPGAVSMWPGLWLVPLTLGAAAGSNRRNARTCGGSSAESSAGSAGSAGSADEKSLVVAMVVTPKLLDSEQFQLLLDLAQLDRQAVLSRIDPGAMVGEDQVHRLATMLAWLHDDALEIRRCVSELAAMSQQLGESYEELSLLYKLSAHMTVNHEPGQFLTDACRELLQVVGLRWLALQLVVDEPRLNDLSGRLFTAVPGITPGFTPGFTSGLTPELTSGLSADTSEPRAQAPDSTKSLGQIGEQLLQHHLNTTTGPTIIDDTRQLGIEQLAGLGDNLLIVPLVREDESYGILFGCDKLDGSPISSIDSKLCSSLASSLSIFLENRVLYDGMQAMFMGTLHALTSSIDAKDNYTHGHSERVALMSRMLAEAAGLDAYIVERVYLAGLVHDVGKIGVPEAVLRKPGKLTDEEFDWIKQHPTIGARILRGIRQMEDLIPGVLYHHERWDGHGYPEGLAGDQIPLFGKLLGLADSFDAMSSDRTYRRAMSLSDALAEVSRCAGTQFDPELAKIFVELDLTPVVQLATEHARGAGEVRGVQKDPGIQSDGERNIDEAAVEGKPK